MGLAPHGREPVSGSGRDREPAARGPHPHDDLDLAALSDAIQRRGDGCGRARQLQRPERDQRALSDDDVGRHVPLLRHVQRDGADARLPAVVRSPDRKVRLGRDLGRQHRAPELSRGRERARGEHRAREGRLLHQRLPAAAQQGGLRGLAQGGAEQQARLHPHPQRVRRPAALRGGHLVGGHQRHPERLRRADPRGPQLRDLRDAVLDHRHRRLLRNAERGAVHALVPVRRLLPDVPHPRAGAQGALRLAVERARARPTCSPSTICAIA